MEIEVRDKRYELFELDEIKENATSDIVGIFKIIEEYDSELRTIVGHYRFVDYFYGASLLSEEEIKKYANEYIEKYETRMSKIDNLLYELEHHNKNYTKAQYNNILELKETIKELLKE